MIDGITILNTEIVTNPSVPFAALGISLICIAFILFSISVAFFDKSWSTITFWSTFVYIIFGTIFLIIASCNRTIDGVKYYVTIDKNITLEEFQKIETEYEIVDKQGDIYILYQEGAN